MKPLITIETVPISIEYVEKQTSHKSSHSAKLQISQNENTRTIKSNTIDLPVMDTFEFAPSSSWENLSYTATAQYYGDGNLSMNVQVNSANKDSYAFQNASRGIESMIDSIPKAPDTSSSNLSSMKINFDISHVSGGLSDIESFETSFVPPDLELKVVERPRVIIKYVGGPIYIPRSADPNYDPPEPVDQIFDGKSSFDAKA